MSRKQQYWIGRTGRAAIGVERVWDYSGRVAVGAYSTREEAEAALPRVEAADRAHMAKMVEEGWIESVPPMTYSVQW
jgi:hypothetical protein